MDDETKATQLRLKALMLERTNPGEGLAKLKQVVKGFPKSSTVGHLVLDDIIRIAPESGSWRDAIEACARGQKLRPDRADDFAAEAEACELDKQGKHIEATEVRLKSATRQGERGTILRQYGDAFARLGAGDRAGELYKRGLELTAQEQAPTHAFRQRMADLLIEEEKPREAVEMLITGVRESADQSDEIPRVLVVAMRKCLKAIGFDKESGERNELADDLVALCRDKGEKQALERFSQAAEGLKTDKTS